MEYNYVCSLGTICHSSYFIKESKLKMASYPFDWIFSNINIVIDCLSDDFEKFLDKKYYKNITNSHACTHVKYGKSMFNHYNPLNNEYYEYYVRCVNRFRDLLLSSKNKIFIIMHVNQNNNSNIENEIENLFKLDEILSQKTKNYKIININHFSNRKPKYEIKNLQNNIDLINLFTKSKSDGVKFIKDSDNEFLQKIIFDNYKFNLHQINNNDNNISI